MRVYSTSPSPIHSPQRKQVQFAQKSKSVSRDTIDDRLWYKYGDESYWGDVLHWLFKFFCFPLWFLFYKDEEEIERPKGEKTPNPILKKNAFP